MKKDNCMVMDLLWRKYWKQRLQEMRMKQSGVGSWGSKKTRECEIPDHSESSVEGHDWKQDGLMVCRWGSWLPLSSPSSQATKRTEALSWGQQVQTRAGYAAIVYILNGKIITSLLLLQTSIGWPCYILQGRIWVFLLPRSSLATEKDNIYQHWHFIWWKSWPRPDHPIMMLHVQYHLFAARVLSASF